MADLKAGSLNIEVTADNKRLEKGLKEAEQKVKQTDRKLEEFGKTAERSTEKAKGGFLEATGATQQFQSTNLSSTWCDCWLCCCRCYRSRHCQRL